MKITRAIHPDFQFLSDFKYKELIVLTGTENLIRHFVFKQLADYRNPKVKALIKEAINFAIKDMDMPT